MSAQYALALQNQERQYKYVKKLAVLKCYLTAKTIS